MTGDNWQGEEFAKSRIMAAVRDLPGRERSFESQFVGRDAVLLRCHRSTRLIDIAVAHVLAEGYVEGALLGRARCKLQVGAAD